MFSSSNSKSLLTKHVRLNLETLEAREVLYAVSGSAWIVPDLITISFVPDGTVIGSNASGPVVSNMQATFNSLFGSAATWQNQILKAAQAWAQQTNINFAVVTDNGAEIGDGDYQQGDSGFGDIRIGGYDFGTTTLAQAFMPPDENGTSFAGDVQFNTTRPWAIGSGTGTYDVFTVALHEFGHSLGLYHGASGSAMFGNYSTVRTGLAADDINGIRAITSWSANGFSSPGYGGARAADSYDLAAANGTLATASTITSTINTTTKTALLENLNITATSDADFYMFVVPTGLGGTLTLKAQSTGLSLLAPTLTLYNSSNTQLATQTAGTTDYDGSTLTISYAVTAGQTYRVKVAGASATATGTGKYALAMGFAGVAAPTASSPNTQTANDPLATGGGGQAFTLGSEIRVNTTTANIQTLPLGSSNPVGMDSVGNYVIAWESLGQDGSGAGIYAQRFDAAGVKVGSEFRVNTTTTGDQRSPAVVMAPDGRFVVVWMSHGQDGSGWGVYAQRYDAAGAARGSEFRINATTAGDQDTPVIGMDSAGNFVVAWEGVSGSSREIYARRFDSTGAALGGEFRVNTSTTNNQREASISVNATGAFVIGWTDWDANEVDGVVYVQRYNASGVAQGGQVQVNTTTTGAQFFPSVGLASDGSFVVTWNQEYTYNGAMDVYAQRFTAAGAKVGGEFLVTTFAGGSQEYGRVAVTGTGNFFVTWDSLDQDGSGSYGVYGQQFRADGTRQGGEFRINNTVAGDQYISVMGLNANGQAVIAWQGNGTGDATGIYSQRYLVTYGGTNPMQAEPHSFGPNGCSCGQVHGQAPQPTGCGCGMCSTAVAVVRPGGEPQVLALRENDFDQFTSVAGQLELRPGAHGPTADHGRGWSWAADATADARADQDARPTQERGADKAVEPLETESYCVSGPAFEPLALWL